MPTTVTKTIKSSGGDYTSLAAWEAGEQRDLVAADEIAEAECYAFADNSDNVSIDGWTTDATRYIRIFTPTAERHDGTPGTGYRVRSAGFGNAMQIVEPDVKVEGIAFFTGSSGNRQIYVNQATPNVEVAECYFDATGITFRPVTVENMTGGTVKIRNCAAWCADDTAPTGYLFSGTGGTVYLYNSSWVTLKSNDAGFNGGIRRLNTVTVVVKNCLSVATSGTISNWASYNGTFDASSTNNVASHGTAPGSNAISGTPTFVDVANGDTHLSASDTVAKEAGVNLRSDANYPVVNDIDGERRSLTPDIGADEVAQFGDILQRVAADNIATYPSTSVQATFPLTPVEDNLLVAVHATGAADSSGVSNGTNSYGLALECINATEADWVGLYWRFAGAAEPTTITATSSAADENMLLLLEVRGPWAASPVDIAFDEGRHAAATTYEIGATGNTAQASELAVAFAYWRVSHESTNWSDSFVSHEDSSAETDFKGSGLATRLLTSIQTLQTTVTIHPTDTAVAQGGIVTFRAPASGVSGDLAATEAADTTAISGDVLVQGDLAATEAADTTQIDATSAIEGDLAATEAADTTAIVADVLVQGDLAASEAGDTTAISADVLVQGDLAATEAADTTAIAGGVSVQGDLAASEAADTTAINGDVLVEGDLAATEAADTTALAGDVLVQGDLAATEAADTTAINASSQLQATLAATEGADVTAVSGAVSIIAQLAASETADTTLIQGIVPVAGDLAATEGSDTTLIQGGVLVEGDLAASEAADTTSINASSLVEGDLAATEGADTTAIAGQVPILASLGVVEGADSTLITGIVPVQGDLAASEAADVTVITSLEDQGDYTDIELTAEYTSSISLTARRE